MNIIIVEDRLLILLLILLEIENTDSLLPDRSNIPLNLINRIATFRAVNYFVHITTTV